VDGIGLGRSRRIDDSADVEEVNRGGALGLGLDDVDPEPTDGAPDPARDLAAVGDEQPTDLPNRRSFAAVSARCAARRHHHSFRRRRAESV